MTLRFLVPIAFALAAFPGSDSAPAAERLLNGHTFTLPDGFTIEAVAGPELVPRPISGSFDPQGHLYVTDSSGSNLPPAEQLKDPKSRILRLEDTDADGRFDRVTVFADRVMFPQGCLWHDGSVYVAGPPSIWKFTDTDGDGVADRREEWYQGKVLTGCANDVHGPYLGPEGMLYWTKGAFARLDLKDHRGRPIDDRCAHIFRAWPDRSGFESVMSGGMDNPVEIAFTAEGEPIVISTFIDLSQPGRRDGLAHAVYGGVFGKMNDVVDEPMVRRTGDLLPPLVQFGPAAACALTRYQSDAFGPEYRDNLFGTLFNLRKVTRHVLRLDGASYAAETTDFLVSDQFDFRPTDVLEDIDGSLLVIDTGGWYKLCCPSSQLAKADVLGGIYRVRRSSRDRTSDSPATVDARRAAYRRLIGPPRFGDNADQTALKRAALGPRRGPVDLFIAALRTHSPGAASSPVNAHYTRVAAEALGRIGEAAAIPALMDALDANAGRDRFLEHSLLFALIEIGIPPALKAFLASDRPVIRRAALLALEQVPGGSALSSADVAPALASSDPALRDSAQWIARRHPEWGTELASHFRNRLTGPAVAATERAAWEGLLGLLTRVPAGQQLLAEALTDSSFPTSTQLAALTAMADAGLKEMPASWRHSLAATFARKPRASNLERLATALRVARTPPLPKEGDPSITAALRDLAADASVPLALRIDALAALPAGTRPNDAEFALLRDALAPDRSPSQRLAAAGACARFPLDPLQLGDLTGALATAGPIELPRLLAAFAGGGTDALGGKLLDALTTSKALRALRPDDLLPHLAKFSPAIRERAGTLLSSVRSDASLDSARLDALLAELQKLQGQIRQGQTLFNSTKAACSSCHRIGYLGGDLGPDLTAIGTVRSERDLLEAVLYPSASLVRSYESWIAETTDGEQYSGVLRRDTPEEIVLATGPGAESRIARANLGELRLGTVSIMPAGLDEQLTRQELADLIVFLKNTRWGAN